MHSAANASNTQSMGLSKILDELCRMRQLCYSLSSYSECMLFFLIIYGFDYTSVCMDNDSPPCKSVTMVI